MKANVGNGAAKAGNSSFNNNRILAMSDRHFNKLKCIALILAFLISFLVLFYKTRVLDPDEYYIEHIIKVLAITHSLVSFGIMVAYYELKAHMVIFKREKEIARKLEFQGMWIAEQPSEDDLRSHWDKLVLSTPTYPEMYWDKFVKKKVKAKYAEQFDVQQLAKLMGINAKNDEYKFDNTKKKSKEPEEKENVNPGFFARLKSIDWRYQIWKWGVMFTDNSFLYNFWYLSFSVIGNFNYFFFACHLLDVAISIKTLAPILKSITHNGKQLLLTIMLMSIIVYGYTVNFFGKFYSNEKGGKRSGAGIGDELESPVGDNMEFYRIIFDMTFFFLFFIVILQAIIQGLITDAFGDLRDQPNENASLNSTNKRSRPHDKKALAGRHTIP